MCSIFQQKVTRYLFNASKSKLSFFVHRKLHGFFPRVLKKAILSVELQLYCLTDY